MLYYAFTGIFVAMTIKILVSKEVRLNFFGLKIKLKK